MDDKLLKTLETADDHFELADAAAELAESQSATDLETLQKFLQRGEFLTRLDPPEPEDPPARPNIVRVLEVLSENRHDGATEVLVKLTQTKGFLMNADRVDALIHACSSVRPPPPEVVKFWDMYCKSGDGFSHSTICALLNNGTGPALDLFKQKMSDPEHEASDKTYWMRNYVVPHRNEARLLDCSQQLLQGGLDEDLRPTLVEALFDYDPTWYPPSKPPAPPPLASYGPTGRIKACEVGELALRAVPNLTPQQRQAVEETVRRLRGREASE